MVLDAGPSPDVLVATVVPSDLEDSGGCCPHDHAENKPADGEESVVDADLLGALVTAAAVPDEDDEANAERDA